MVQSEESEATSAQSYDIVDLLRVIWEEKLKCFLMAAIAGLLSLVLAVSLPNIYQARALLAPKSDGGSGGLSQLAAQYGGLASLAGINLGSASGEGLTKPALAREKVKSLSFFEEHLYEDVLVELMAIRKWELGSNKIYYDSAVYNEDVGKWVREVDAPLSQKPSPQEAHKKFLEILSVTESKQTGLTTITIEHKSPYVAARWLRLLIDRVSEDLRERDIKEAEDSIRFLESQRDLTSIVSLDEVFAQLIEEQTKTIMLAKVSSNYVFEIIDPPVVSERKVRPARALICLLGVVLGVMLGICYVLTDYYVKERLV